MKRIVWWLIVVLAVMAPAGASGSVTLELSQERLTSPSTSVLLAGSFTEWSSGPLLPLRLEGTTWRITLDLPDGQHQYKFVWTDASTKRHWKLDPRNPYLTGNGKFGANNLLEVRAGVRVVPGGAFERFEWKAPTAKWVNVAGDFNGWNMSQFPLQRQDDGRWLAYLPLQRPFAYKLIVDGIWQCDLQDRAARVPNGFGGLNSYRPSSATVSASAAVSSTSIVQGDTAGLTRVRALAEAGDYDQAVAAVRAIIAQESAASGSTSPLVLTALSVESGIHKRWNRPGDAATCWQRLADSNVNTTETFRAICELATYHLFVTQNLPAGRRLAQRAVALAPNNLERVRASLQLIRSTQGERRFRDVAAQADQLLAASPSPENQDKPYACELAELWLIKGVAHYEMREWDKAREAFQKAIQVHPWDDSEQVQKARRWIRSCDRRQKNPNG